MNTISPVDFDERLTRLLTDPQAIPNLKRYFTGTSGPGGPPLFTGARFEYLDGGGDIPATANVITASDLIAVQLLSVDIPGPAALALLEGDLGRQLSSLLADIPSDKDMVDVDVELLRPGSPADQAWHALQTQRGLGWVTTNKLLARKRPRLLPVYDRVVRCAVDHPDSFWLSLHHALTANGNQINELLLHLRSSAGLPDTVSALRVCDVVLWMHHVDAHRERGCPGPFA